MPRFPSLEWCRALVATAQQDPELAVVAREWAGRTIGVVVSSGDGLAQDFCVFVRPHASKPELVELKQCEDEDDLELEEPDYFFKLPFSLAKKLLRKEADPFAVLRAGQVRADGDLKFLVPFAQRWQPLGDRVGARLETVL